MLTAGTGNSIKLDLTPYLNPDDSDSDEEGKRLVADSKALYHLLMQRKN